MKSPIRIGIFKPTNIRNDNAFATGQHIIFSELNNLELFDITYFSDDKNTSFPGIKTQHLTINEFKTLQNRILRKLTGKFYFKIPAFQNLSFKEFDLIITEGLHYPLLFYLNDYSGKILFNDSITLDKMFTKKKIIYFNSIFKNKTSVLVNYRIKKLYEKYKIENKTVVISHALDTSKIRFEHKEKFDGNILSVGRLEIEKGIDIILRALRLLKDEGIHFKYDIYGVGSQQKNLMKLTNELELTNYVNFKGFVENNKLLELFSNYSLFISHPITTKHVAEAFNMAMAEAICSGLPSMTSKCGGMEDVFKNQVSYCEEKNVLQLSQVIKKLIREEENFSNASKSGAKYIREKFDKKIIIKKWEKIIKETVA